MTYKVVFLGLKESDGLIWFINFYILTIFLMKPRLKFKSLILVTLINIMIIRCKFELGLLLKAFEAASVNLVLLLPSFEYLYKIGCFIHMIKVYFIL